MGVEVGVEVLGVGGAPVGVEVGVVVLGVGGAPVGVEIVGATWVVEVPDRPDRPRRAGGVWKLSSPTSPTAVPAITITGRLMCECTGGHAVRSAGFHARTGDFVVALASEREPFFVDAAAGHPQPRDTRDHKFVEALGSTDIDVAPRDIGDQLGKC